ncbi:hypothetical protein H9X95_08810 [Micromonospora chalcea]|uniref:hypothetical protein n=1 Tax=Micromonospora chalcea TaxID=1874 RepID=UPI001656C692|nr:hypothetical protein [Micromonospora chalcea]MBC8990257.1 hypothetical protein [Micromonospora chalcea]
MSAAGVAAATAHPGTVSDKPLRPPSDEDREPIAGVLIGAAVAAIPVSAAVERLFIISRGDFVVLFEAMNGTTFAPLLASSALLLIGSGLPLVLLSLLHVFTHSRGGGERRRPGSGFWAAFAVFMLPAVLSSYNYFNLVMATAAALLTLVAWSRWNAPLSLFRTIAGFSVLVTLGSFALVPVPAPDLILTKQNPTPRWQYVLKVDDTHTTLLNPRGGLQRVPNEEIKARVACPEAFHYDYSSPHVNQSLAGRLLLHKERYVDEMCKTAPRSPIR